MKNYLLGLQHKQNIYNSTLLSTYRILPSCQYYQVFFFWGGGSLIHSKLENYLILLNSCTVFHSMKFHNHSHIEGLLSCFFIFVFYIINNTTNIRYEKWSEVEEEVRTETWRGVRVTEKIQHDDKNNSQYINYNKDRQ